MEDSKDLISRQAAIDALGERPLAWTESEYETGLQNQWEADVDAIKAVPSAQPEIIRCKECKYRRADTLYSYCEKLYRMGVLDIYCYMTSDDDFCSMAERR